MVNLVVLLVVAKPMFHLSARVSGEIPCLLVDATELIFTLFVKDEVKSFIIVGGSREC